MTAKPAMAGVAIVVASLALAACGSSSPATRPSSRDALADPVLMRGLSDPRAYAADGELYVIQRVMPPVNQVWGELMRVSQISGRVEAVRRLESGFDQALLASGVLWVTTKRG
jgi:hypothetical protein